MSLRCAGFFRIGREIQLVEIDLAFDAEHRTLEVAGNLTLHAAGFRADVEIERQAFERTVRLDVDVRVQPIAGQCRNDPADFRQRQLPGRRDLHDRRAQGTAR